MATYRYMARDSGGRAVAGVLDAESEVAVVGRLREMGLFTTRVTRDRQRVELEGLFGRWRGVGLKNLAVFTRQLSAMINAGLAIVGALGILAQQVTNRRLEGIIGDVRRDIESGLTLSDSMAKHPDAFNGLYVNMVRAGETGGVLDEVLARLAMLLEKEVALRNKIKAASAYPAMIALAAAGIVCFIIFYILPQFSTFLLELNVPLPLPTRILIFVSTNAVRYWYVLLITAIALAAGGRAYIKSPSGRPNWDRLKLRIPILGPLNLKVAIARFSRTLGTLISSGVPILNALDVVARAVDNHVVTQAVGAIRSSVREGESISGPMQQSAVFPPMVVHMVAVGERTGSLDAMLIKVADFYDEEVEYAVEGLTSVLEPVMILFMGGIVGFIVVSFYLPIFGLMNSLAR